MKRNFAQLFPSETLMIVKIKKKKKKTSQSLEENLELTRQGKEWIQRIQWENVTIWLPFAM